MRRTVLAFATAAMLIAGCSGESSDSGRIGLESAPSTTVVDGSGGEDPGTTTGPSIPEVEAEGRDGYVEALALNLELDPDNAPLLGGSSTCIAEAWIDELGADRLEAAGTSPQELAEQRSMDVIIGLGIDLEQSRKMMDAMPDCGADLLNGVMESPAFANAPADIEACLRDGLTQDMILDMLASSLSDQADTDEGRAMRQPVEDLVLQCSPELGG